MFHKLAKLWAILLVTLLASWITIQFSSLTLSAFSTSVSFDGGMNLQVAANLAEGRGYARFYNEWRLFPQEIQTNAPYILPAAAVFKFMGVTPISAHMISVIYLAALIGVVIWLVRPIAGWPGALSAAALVLLIPQLGRFGMLGYGEIPALFWFLMGLGLVCRSLERPGRLLPLGAGICLGLAFLTKTVMAMPIGILGACLLIWMIRDRTPAKVLWIAAGGVLAIGAFELWKLFQFGQLQLWLEWWHIQIKSILAQAGVVDAYHDSPNLVDKLKLHITALGQGLRISPYLPILLAPLAGALLVIMFQRQLPASTRFLVLILSLSIMAYFVWWLAITPTEKAWYRRIINGVILLSLSAPIALALARQARKSISVMITGSALLTLSVLLYAGIRFLNISFPLQPTPGLRTVLEVSEYMQQQQPNSRFYGRGWYSAPVFSLYSGVPVYELEAHRNQLEAAPIEHYLLVDKYFAPQSQEESALADFDSEVVLDKSPWGRIIRFSNKP